MGKREGKTGAAPLGYMLLLAAALHIVFILTVGFTPEEQQREAATRRSLKVVVTRPQPTPAEEPADDTPSPPAPAPEPTPPIPEKIVKVPPSPEPTLAPAPEPVPEPTPPAEPTTAPTLAAQVAQEKVEKQPKPPAKPKKPRKKNQAKPKPKAKKRITAAQLLASRSDANSRHNKELERKTVAYAVLVVVLSTATGFTYGSIAA